VTTLATNPTRLTMDQETLQKSLESAAKLHSNGAIAERKDKDGDNGGGDEAAAKENAVKDIVAKEDDSSGGEKVEFKVIYNKKKYDVSFPLDCDVSALKAHLHPIIDIPPAMMKVMIKGMAKDEMTLRKLGVNKGSKVMVVGSSLNDVLSVSTTPSPQQIKEEEKAATAEAKKDSSSSREKQHKKVLDKGKPDDVMPARKGAKESLPSAPLSGMLNKNGGKVRLTFKLEQDQVWIGTKERTEKLGMSSIKAVVSEQIEGFEDYHILALQLGPTEASRYWIYWVPAQYVEAIKESVLGKWQMF
jgi:hypothetical protein